MVSAVAVRTMARGQRAVEFGSAKTGNIVLRVPMCYWECRS
jgi:hypothetical protein